MEMPVHDFKVMMNDFQAQTGKSAEDNQNLFLAYIINLRAKQLSEDLNKFKKLLEDEK